MMPRLGIPWAAPGAIDDSGYNAEPATPHHSSVRGSGPMDYKMFYLARRHPSVAPEDWPKHWRSHPKFVSQFPTIGGRIENLFYTARVYNPTIDGAAADILLLDTEFDGVAVVSSPEDTLAGNEPQLDIFEKVMEDERRVFGDYTSNSVSYGREILVLGGERNRAAVIRFLRHRPGLSVDEFQARWAALQDMAQAAIEAGKMSRYVHTMQCEPLTPGHEYDGVSEAWFASPEDAAKAFGDPDLAPLFDADGAFSDPGQSVTMLTETIYSWPRL